ALREVQDSQNHSVTFAPVFTFVSLDGRSHSITSNSSSNPAGFEVGDTVHVLYDPAAPSGAKIDTFWQLWGIAVVFGGIGATFTPIGIVSLVIARAQRRRELAAQRPIQPGVTSEDAPFRPDVTWRGGNIDPM
ncbi:MAG TPA: DUF3592 domain-containing protein, partial [Acidobacteriaceae bacterium]